MSIKDFPMSEAAQARQESLTLTLFSPKTVLGGVGDGTKRRPPPLPTGEVGWNVCSISK